MKRGLILVAAALAAAGCSSNRPGRSVQTQEDQPRPYQAESEAKRYDTYADLVGPRGADGPQGPAGAQGPAGQTGEAGAVLAGPRGADGPAGPAGASGPQGATGPEGALVRGPTGVAGRAGPAGDRGQAGPTGKQGASTEGYAGPAGATGPEGARGEAGPTGDRGPTLVGPAGPAGRSGAEGEQGVAGQAGARGETSEGVAGVTGRSGAAGERGTAGPAGEQGPAGVVDRWTSYREIWFKADQADVEGSQSAKVAEIANYLKENPSLQVGVDASINTRGTDERLQRLCDDRVAAIYEALKTAGVPDSKIRAGAFGDPALRRDGRVEVLISTPTERAQANR